jgi:hypothetical protein
VEFSVLTLISVKDSGKRQNKTAKKDKRKYYVTACNKRKEIGMKKKIQEEK